MDIPYLSLAALLWVSLTSLVLLVVRNWRASVIVLSLQYLGVFVLIVMRWPLESAVVKLVAGWMACATLAIAAGESRIASSGGWQPEEQFWPSGPIFRILAAGLVWITVFSLAQNATEWIPGLGLAQAWGGLTLIGMGLLQLGLTAQPLRVVVGLLTAISGFEILYSSVESSALLTGLLAAVNMGLALIGAYLITTPEMETDE